MRRSVLLVLALLTCGGLAIAGSSSAPAHDALLNTSPANGEQLTGRPPTVTLTFAAPQLSGTSKLIATADTGERMNLDDVTQAGPQVRATWPQGLPSGAYVIAWRSVASDGHPLTGTFNFSYTTPGEGPTPTGTGGTPDVSALPVTPSSTADSAVTSTSSGIWIAVTFGGVLVIVLVLILMTIMRRRSNNSPDS